MHSHNQQLFLLFAELHILRKLPLKALLFDDALALGADLLRRLPSGADGRGGGTLAAPFAASRRGGIRIAERSSEHLLERVLGGKNIRIDEMQQRPQLLQVVIQRSAGED